MKKKLVVLSGAGMSQESGLKTFRDMGGLWEQYDVTEVASIDAWQRQSGNWCCVFTTSAENSFGKPNQMKAYRNVAGLENGFDVDVITQNVDDLHEQAGSSKVLHLHGELAKSPKHH